MKKHATIFLLWLLFANQSTSLAQNLVFNGDFEEDFKYWSSAGNVSIEPNRAYSGAKSLKVSTLSENYGYIYQGFARSFAVFEATFWVYPLNEDYHSVFEFVSNWTPSDYLEDKYVVRTILAQDSIKLVALNADTTIRNILETNYWNKIKVVTDSSGLEKSFFINDQFICKLVSSALFPVEHLFIGDVSTRGSFGTLYYDLIVVLTDTTATQVTKSGGVPIEFALHQNYPNPFNFSTTIKYQLPATTDVKLEIYNLLGQCIRTLVDQSQMAGSYLIRWDGTDDFQQSVASGIYLYQLKTKNSIQTNKLIILH